MFVKVLQIGQPQFEKADSCLYTTKGRAPGYSRNISYARSIVQLTCNQIDESGNCLKSVVVILQIKKLFPKWRNTDKNISNFLTNIYPKLQSYLLNRNIEVDLSIMRLSSDLDSYGQIKSSLQVNTFDLVDSEYSAILAIL